MAVKCPLTNDYVLYLECKECEVEYECRMGILKKEEGKKMPKGHDIRIAEDFAYLSKVDCSACFESNYDLTGDYYYDDSGFYVNIVCRECGAKTEYGDGEFLTEVASFDGRHFHLLEED